MLKDKEPAAERLAVLEHSLQQIASGSRIIQELFSLYARYPDLFRSVDPNVVPTTLMDSASILSIILASASSYPSTASRLTSILDVPIPSTALSAQLIDLRPRIAQVEALQARQSAEIGLLRKRSAEVLQCWYALDVLYAGERWAELESRIEDAEQKVRRAEIARELDDNLI